MSWNVMLYYWFKFTVVMLPLGLFVTMLMYELVMEYVVWLKYQIEPPIEDTFEWQWDFKRPTNPMVTYLAAAMLMSSITVIADNGDYVRLSPRDLMKPRPADVRESMKAVIVTRSHVWTDARGDGPDDDMFSD